MEFTVNTWSEKLEAVRATPEYQAALEAWDCEKMEALESEAGVSFSQIGGM